MRLPTNLLGPPRTFYRIPLDPLHTLNRSRPPTLLRQSLYRPSTDPQPLTNLLEAFHKASTDRMDMTLYGIQSENMRKLRSGAGDADDSVVDDTLLYDVYRKKYAVRLNHPIITAHGATYPSALGSHIEWEIKLAQPTQLIVTSNSNTVNYRLTNIQMEYETLKDEDLAREIAGYYNGGKSFLYEHMHHFRTIPFKESDSIINENINLPRKSIRGLVILFTKNQDQDKINSELFVNPKLTSVSVTIEGIANKVYAQKILPRHLWREPRRYFMEDKDCCVIDVDETDFLKNKFCLFIDLRNFQE